VILPVCLAAPGPAFAMIERLPIFFAMTGMVVVLGTVPFAAMLKRLLMGVLFRQGAVVSWQALHLVTFAEAVIMACSFLLFLVSAGSRIVPHGRVPIVFSGIFACSAILYSVVAMMPELWLLKRTQIPPDASGQPHDHPFNAWLLSLPTPFVMILWVVALYAAC
jgi:hypothetical protein